MAGAVLREDVSYKTPDPMALEGAAESSLDGVPGDFLADLVGGARDANDPGRRDYGERYVYKGVLGEGGQGVVICAEDKLLGREVAIKALKNPLDPAREEHLEREARICGVLEHPNILPTYDLCRDETGSPFFVMKKIEGVSLEGLLKASHSGGEKLPPEWKSGEDYSRRRLINIFLQVCYAVEFAHSRGIYHLDLKPQNVKLGSFGEVYVLDWGFAARKEEDPKYIAGTPIYIAPERFTVRRPGARSDVYSLGVMLYRILTGRLPREVSKLTFREYRDHYRDFPLIPPRQRDSSVPPELEAIVLKAMSENPEGRYASAKEMAKDIERFLDLLPVSAYREGVLGRAWKCVRRHKAAAAVSAVAVAAALAVGTVAYQNHFTAIRALRLQQEKDESARLRDIRIRARMPLEKAGEIVWRHRDKIEKTASRAEKAALLAPAFALFDQAIAIDPAFAGAYYERGKANELARNPDAALADYRQALELDESYIMAHYYAGRIYIDLRMPERAQAEFAAMTGMQDPDNEFAELGRAHLDLNAGRYDQALERCARVEKLNPGLSDIWYIRGLVYQKSSRHLDLDKALAAYDEFLARRQDMPSAFLNRGAIKSGKGDYDGAVADYRAALAVQPDYKWALHDLGYLLAVNLDKAAEGLDYLDQGIKVDPNDPWGYLPRAAVYDKIRQPDKAEADYRKALSLAPADPNTHYRLGVFLLQRRRFPESEKELSESIRLAGKESDTRYHRRGVARLAQGKYPDAVSDFEEAIRIRGSETIYPALMRWISMQLRGGEPIDRDDFERRLSAPPDKPWLSAIGSYYLGDGRAEEALALAKTPEARCETCFYLGAGMMVKGDRPGAAEMFRQSLATGVHLYMEYALAGVFLERLQGAGEGAVAP